MSRNHLRLIRRIVLLGQSSRFLFLGSENLHPFLLPFHDTLQPGVGVPLDHGECPAMGAVVRYALWSVIRFAHAGAVLLLLILHDIVALVLPFVVERTPCIVQRWRNKLLRGICRAPDFPAQAVVLPVSV